MSDKNVELKFGKDEGFFDGDNDLIGEAMADAEKILSKQPRTCI